MGGKGGMTSKRVWTWGRTSTANISDPVDYAHEAVVTRAGYIGIKVRRCCLLLSPNSPGAGNQAAFTAQWKGLPPNGWERTSADVCVLM
jgi:hypothetical protein